MEPKRRTSSKTSRRRGSGTDLDRQLTDSLSSYWVNFAASGDPHGMVLPRWPVFDEKKSGPLVLGDRIELGAAPNQSQLAFYQAVYDRQRK